MATLKYVTISVSFNSSSTIAFVQPPIVYVQVMNSKDQASEKLGRTQDYQVFRFHCVERRKVNAIGTVTARIPTIKGEAN